MENIPQKEDSSLAVSIEGSRRRVARRLLDLDRTSMGFQATFLTYLTRFRTIAACWDYLKRKRNPGVSLRNFVGSEKVYLLVNDPEKEASLAPINRLMIERLCTLIRASDPGMSQNNPGFPRHWVVIDEAVSLGKLPGIPKLFDDGRGRGAAGMLGFQNVHGMYDVDGENATNKLIDLCGNKAILRADAKSADEAAAIFGELEGARKYRTVDEVDQSAQTLRPWTDGDLKRLGLKKKEPVSKSASRKKAKPDPKKPNNRGLFDDL